MTYPLTLEQQLLELAALRDGWLDGEGSMIPSLTLLQTAQRVREHLSYGRPMPYLYPREDGGVSAEWDDDGGGHFTIEPIPPLLSKDEARELWLRVAEDDDE